MNKFIALAAVVIGGVVVFKSRSSMPRDPLGSALGRRMLRHMEQIMASLPDNAPPKLVMSVLPRLCEQNDQIIGMLQEQNALLREHFQRSP